MAKSAVQEIPHRRRREQKTDYRLRLSLLKSGKARLVVRRSNRYVYAQLVKYSPEGDEILAQADSSELTELGWNSGTNNTAAAFLTGLLAAQRAKEEDIDEAIMDIGLQKSSPGGVLYACLQGAVEGGLNIPHNPDILPDEERVTGKHINAEEEFEDVKEKIEG